jgi:hypothetical protein
MANEVRLRSNNQTGTITDNPLTAGATTVNSPSFVNLPAVTTSNHLIIIMDPLAVNGAPEIMQVTAHTASSSSLTVVRGFETTTPRQHNLGTTWFHGPVVSDYNYTQRTALSTNRPTSPYTGEQIYETDTARWTVWNGSVWLPAPHNVPMCNATHSVNQSIANNAQTVVAFDSETFDTDGMHSNVSNNSRITINTSGVYILTATGEFAAGTDYTQHGLFFRLNGATPIGLGDAAAVTAASGTWSNASLIRKFSAGDYIELIAQQVNGAAAARNLNGGLSYTPFFAAAWIGVG